MLETLDHYKDIISTSFDLLIFALATNELAKASGRVLGKLPRIIIWMALTLGSISLIGWLYKIIRNILLPPEDLTSLLPSEPNAPYAAFGLSILSFIVIYVVVGVARSIYRSMDKEIELFGQTVSRLTVYIGFGLFLLSKLFAYTVAFYELNRPK